MEQVVADASVIAKLFLNETYSEMAYKLRDSALTGRISLAEPSLLFYEVINGIRYSKAKRFSVEELKTAATALFNYDFTIFELDGTIAEKAIEVSKQHNISVYDAAYIALAAITHSKLYTADTDLVETVDLPFVKHIKDF